MDNKINQAINRLNSILPLLSGLQSLRDEDARLYCSLLNSYVAQGRAPDRTEIAGMVTDAEQSLKNIAAGKLIVLDAAGNPAGAYPFTSEQREHRVQINGITVHCMCALDALSVSPMFGQKTIIDSECRVTGDDIHLVQNGTLVTEGTLDACFGIDWGAATENSSCAESLCLDMIFLADEETAKRWLTESADTREIFDLQSAVEFAAAFFVPLAENCQAAA
jgi:hypothetical protein